MSRLRHVTFLTLAIPATAVIALAEELPAPRTMRDYRSRSLPPVREELVPLSPYRDRDPAYHDARRVSDSEPEQIVERYPDRAVKIERQVIQDRDRNYVNHGPWKMLDPQGRVVALGEYRYGEQHGSWTRWMPAFGVEDGQFQAPYVSQTEFSDGKLQGTWTISDSRQRPIGSWEFSDGRLHGKAVTWYATGQPKQEMTFDNGALDGEITYWTPQGTVARREYFRDGRQLIPVVDYHDPQQKKAEGWLETTKIVVHVDIDWWEGILEINREPHTDEPVRVGEWTEWHPNGTVSYRGEFRHGKPVGEHIWWHENGQKLVVGNYQQGLQEELWTRWHPNGQKQQEGIYVAGVKRGTWRSWDSDGQLADVRHMDEEGPGRRNDVLALDDLPRERDRQFEREEERKRDLQYQLFGLYDEHAADAPDRNERTMVDVDDTSTQAYEELPETQNVSLGPLE